MRPKDPHPCHSTPGTLELTPGLLRHFLLCLMLLLLVLLM